MELGFKIKNNKVATQLCWRTQGDQITCLKPNHSKVSISFSKPFWQKFDDDVDYPNFVWFLNKFLFFSRPLLDDFSSFKTFKPFLRKFWHKILTKILTISIVDFVRTLYALKNTFFTASYERFKAILTSICEAYFWRQFWTKISRSRPPLHVFFTASFRRFTASFERFSRPLLWPF